MVTSSMNLQKITILLVEDSESDARLIKEFLKEIKVNNELIIVTDGIEALSYLHTHCKPVEDCPSIVILDLNLPRMGGHEVLKEMKKDKDLKRIPVIILTTSTDKEDITKCYNDFASSYITKPVDFDKFAKIMESIANFWFNTAVLPSQM